MDQQTLVAILLGGLGGAVAAEVIEIVRDGARHRRLVRMAARVVRTEIIANMGLVSVALALGTVPRGATLVFRSDRFERHIDVLIGELSRDDTAILLAFDAMHAGAEDILRTMQAGTANPTDVAWLTDTWEPAANLCQGLMDFTGGRWWDRLARREDWKKLEAARKEFDKKATGS